MCACQGATQGFYPVVAVWLSIRCECASNTGSIPAGGWWQRKRDYTTGVSEKSAEKHHRSAQSHKDEKGGGHKCPKDTQPTGGRPITPVVLTRGTCKGIHQHRQVCTEHPCPPSLLHRWQCMGDNALQHHSLRGAATALLNVLVAASIARFSGFHQLRHSLAG